MGQNNPKARVTTTMMDKKFRELELMLRNVKNVNGKGYVYLKMQRCIRGKWKGDIFDGGEHMAQNICSRAGTLTTGGLRGPYFQTAITLLFLNFTNHFYTQNVAQTFL